MGDYNFDGAIGSIAYKFKVVLFKAKLRYLSGGAGCLIMCLWLKEKTVLVASPGKEYVDPGESLLGDENYAPDVYDAVHSID